MQQENRFWQGVRKAYACYDRMMEKQGFYVVLIICVLIILSSAFYTFHFRQQNQEKPAGYDEAASLMAGGMQMSQTLEQAQELIESQGAEKVAVPTEKPFRFVQPVSGFLDRDFSMTEPQLFKQANYWRVHPGIDLQTEYGAAVKACASGRVARVWQDHEMGLCVRIDHENGYETVYAGLCNADYVKKGDPITQGQTLGHVGNGVLAEADALPHLHFEAWRSGEPVDPITLFLGIDE